MDEEERFTLERQQMIDEQLAGRDIHDPAVLGAIAQVPRHRFVLPEYRHLAYADGPLPIGNGQTISQPYIVALMTQLLQLKGDEKVLEIGTGSAYQAAILGRLARQVHSIERHPALAGRARRILEELGFENVIVHTGDGSRGLPEEAPFDAIIVTAAAPVVHQALLDQLTERGCLVIPVGGIGGQYLECWRREAGSFSREVVAPVAFVPLRGELGWHEDRWEEPGE